MLVAQASVPKIDESTLRVQRRGTAWVVTAVRDIAPGELALVPCIPSIQFLLQTCTHPHRVATRAAVPGGTFWLLPALRAPGAGGPRGDTEREAWLAPFW